jgi:hypothetical protein
MWVIKSGSESFFIKKQGFAVLGSFGVATPLSPLTASLFFKKRITIHRFISSSFTAGWFS